MLESGIERVSALTENDIFLAYTHVDRITDSEITRLGTVVETYGYIAQGLAVALRDVLPIVEESVEETGTIGPDFAEAFRQNNRLLQRAKSMLKTVDEHPILHVRDIAGEDIDAMFDIKFED